MNTTTIQPSKELTTGRPFIKWYQIRFGRLPIATNTPVQAALVDNIRADQESLLLIPAKSVSWNPTGGRAGTGAWEVAFSDIETALVRSQPGNSVSKLRLSSAYLELKVGAPYNFTRHDLISIGKGIL